MTLTITRFAGPRFIKLATIVILLATACTARVNAGPPPDPYADPRHDLYNPLRYIASDTLTAVAFSLLSFSTIALAWNMWKYGAKYMLCMVIGAVFFSIGIALRFGLTRDPHSRAIYIVEYLFVILSPCAFIAAIYILLGRLALHLGGTNYLYVPAHRVTVIFLSSDVVTFLVQAGGGGVSTSTDQKMRNLGAKIFVVGLILQLISFAFFASLYLSFLYRVHKNERSIWHRDDSKPWYRNWRTLAMAMGFSCAGILVRSFYRVFELSEGWGGHLATHEGYFYILDTLPLYLAISIFIPFWPGRFIDEKNSTLAGDVEEKTEDSTSTPIPASEDVELGHMARASGGNESAASTQVGVGPMPRAKQ